MLTRTFKLIQKAWDTLMQEGIVAFCFKLGSALGYRRLYLYRRDLSKPLIAHPFPIEVSIRLFNETLLSDYTRFQPEAKTGDVFQRLQKNHLCFCAYQQNKIIASVWVAFNHAWIDYLTWEFPLPRGDAYIYDLLVLPDYRNQGLARALSTYVHKQLQSRQINNSWRVVMPENSSAIALQNKLGNSPQWLLKTLKLKGWSRTWAVALPSN